MSIQKKGKFKPRALRYSTAYIIFQDHTYTIQRKMKTLGKLGFLALSRMKTVSG